MSQPIKFFHEITDEQWEALKATKMTWEECAKEYAPPTWCDYPHAVDPMGCWSLVGRMVTGEDYCRSCDLHKDHPDNHGRRKANAE
jgi:hypothetical protein